MAPVFASIALLNLFRLEIGVHLARFLEFGPEALVAVSSQIFILVSFVLGRVFKHHFYFSYSSPQPPF